MLATGAAGLDGLYRSGTDSATVFTEVPAPTDEALRAVLHKIITRTPDTGPAAWFALGWLASQRGPALRRAVKSLARLDKAPRVLRATR